MKRREELSPANPDNSEYEIYVRRFESQPSPREGSMFFVLNKKQMLMYSAKQYQPKSYSVSEEDLAINFISLSEVLENCITLNKKISISEFDYGVPRRVIHCCANKYAIYKDSIGYQIRVGPLQEIKTLRSVYDEYNKTEGQDDCTIKWCIAAIKKECLQKHESGMGYPRKD